MHDRNMFGKSFEFIGRGIELSNHFLDKQVEVVLRDGKKIEGILNTFSQDFVIVSGKHILNLRYVVSISVI